MINISLNLEKNKKYVVACSFGPDSMALLDCAIKENNEVVVAHVNYRKREASQFEQDSLKVFCEKKGIRFYLLDLNGIIPEGNFQNWAREKRYKFFKEVCEKENAAGVLVAHQQDDVIETYLMQKKRRNLVKKYGISRENTIFGVKVIRPLLAYSKQQLREYDEENNVPFSIDESNLTDHYTRNKIRHSIVEKLTKEEREEILKELSEKRENKQVNKNPLTKEEFLKMSYDEIVLFLSFFTEKVGEHRDLSIKFVDEIKKAFISKTNLRFEITKTILLELDYNAVYVVNGKRLHDYQFKFSKTLQNELFDIDFSNGVEDRGIQGQLSDFIVKNCNKNDEIIIKNYSCKVRRLFIDWKMPLFLREVWPGIYSKNDELVYVPRYRKDFIDEHKSKFKINTEYFIKF